MRIHDLSPWFIRGMYLFGLALMLTAAIDLFTTVWPLRPAEMAWRYGFFGLAAGYIQTPTLGLLLLVGGAALDDDVRVLRVGGIFAFAAAGLLLVSAAAFGLDVLSMRAIRPPESQAGVLYGGMLQEVKYVVGACVLLCLGAGSIAMSRSIKKHTRRDPGIVSAQG